MIPIIGIIVFVVLGLLCIFAPKLCTKADKRDDPEAVAQVKKCGGGFIAFACFIAYFAVKYN